MTGAHMAASAARPPVARMPILLHSAVDILRRSAIRTGLEVAAPLSRVRRLFPSKGRRAIIFTLHHVRPDDKARFAPNAGLSVTPEFLEQAIVTVLRCGFVPVHLHELPAILSDPREERSFVAFTLDDGYKNNAEYAAPVFRKFAVPYTIFITAGFVERSRTIWWETAARLVGADSRFTFDFGNGAEEVQAASIVEKRAAFARLETFVQTAEEDEAVERIDAAARAAGIDPVAIVEELTMSEADLRALAADRLVHFGAHTLTHVNLRRVGADRLRREIEMSARAVESYAGRRPLSFSYPYGWRSAAGEREAAAAAAAGFPVAVTTQPGILDAESLRMQPTALPRISLNGHFQKARYVEALSSGLLFGRGWR